jgi:formamidase
MPKTLFKIDLTKTIAHQELPGHNRWHPDIPAVVKVKPGDVFRIECKDWTDGQIKDDDDPADVRDVKLSVVHVLSGPIHVEGAEPGDILVVDLLDVGALPHDEWGFTGIFDRANGRRAHRARHDPRRRALRRSPRRDQEGAQ